MGERFKHFTKDNTGMANIHGRRCSTSLGRWEPKAPWCCCTPMRTAEAAGRPQQELTRRRRPGAAYTPRADAQAEARSPCALPAGVRHCAATVESSLAASQKVKHASTTQRSVSTPRIYPRETKASVCTKTHVPVFRTFTHNHSSVETS